MTSLARVSLSLVALTLTACVPLPVVDSYHQVSADEGQVNGNCLHGNLGPPSRLGLDRGVVRIDIDGNDLSGFTSSDHQTELRITYHVPMRSTVVFDPDQLKVVDRGNGQPVRLVKHEMTVVFRRDDIFGEFLWIHESRGVAESGNLTPKDVDSLAGTPVDYIDRLDLWGSAPKDFDLMLPAMRIDGISYPGRTIRFDHHVGVFCVFLLIGNYNMGFIR
jgi:hypothetical protein